MFNKFLKMKIALIVGGYSMEKNFATIHDNPDIIVATPGRLLHVLVEMNLNLITSLKFVVVDECDRLFEMGFKEQLTELFTRFSHNRQTLLFSATLPQLIVDFVKAGLHNPVLVRLDVEHKLSENLTSHFIYCRENEKLSILLYLLNRFIKKNEMTVVFTSTRHHVEYLKCVLDWAHIECNFVYSTLDQEARKVNIQRFRSKKVNILLVTDIAARGIDIPFLDNVINFNFPSKPKLYVHRVGRVARAGRSGNAYSFVSPDEVPYLYDLHLFLDKELILASNTCKLSLKDGIFGTAPQELIDNEIETLRKCSEEASLKKVCENANKHYIKTRALPSAMGVNYAKELNIQSLAAHPIFNDYLKERACDNLESRDKLLNSIKNYKPKSTIFEIGPNKQGSQLTVMLEKRKYHDKLVEKVAQKKISEAKLIDNQDKFKDDNFYLPYRPKNHFAEKGLEVDKNYETEMIDAVFDINGDDTETIKRNHDNVKWDRKRKKYIRENLSDPKKRKIKTESGNWISASYKTDLYKKWKEKMKKFQSNNEDEGEDNGDHEDKAMADESRKERRKRDQQLARRFKTKNKGKGRQRVKSELKTKDQVVKTRIKEERKKKFMLWRQKEKSKKRSQK